MTTDRYASAHAPHPPSRIDGPDQTPIQGVKVGATMAPCPNCGQHPICHGWEPRWEWQVECHHCHYCGPRCETQDEAIRRHNKMSQNCGAT